MIRDHVAKSAGSFIEAAAMFHANGFRSSNLHVIDVVAIPQWLDDVIREAKDHQILNGLFSKIMIDTINLVLGEDLLQVLVKLSCGFEVVAEGLFNDHARP